MTELRTALLHLKAELLFAAAGLYLRLRFTRTADGLAAMGDRARRTAELHTPNPREQGR